MSVKQPARLATSLIERMLPAQGRDAVMGDLVEQCQAGRTHLWFWRQVIVAVIVGAAREIRLHKLLAFRAVFMGWAILLLADIPAHWFEKALRGFAPDLAPNHPALALWMFGYKLPCLMIGWIAAAISGFIVVRLHRVSIVWAFVLSVVVFAPPWSDWHNGHRAAWFVNASHDFVAVPLCILVGGLFSQPRSKRLPVDGGVA